MYPYATGLALFYVSLDDTVSLILCIFRRHGKPYFMYP